MSQEYIMLTFQTMYSVINIYEKVAGSTCLPNEVQPTALELMISSLFCGRKFYMVSKTLSWEIIFHSTYSVCAFYQLVRLR